VSSYLRHHFTVDDREVRIRHYRAGSFMLCFRDGVVANQVLQANHEAGALFLPLHYKVLITIENIPAHTWLISMAQKVLGSSALIFDVTTASASASDLSQFLVTRWVT
jgi:hypothetical protein